MDITKGKTALMELGSKPARRTPQKNRELVSGLIEEIRTVREAGYGFDSISKALFEGTGVRIVRSVLEHHYNDLTRPQVNIVTAMAQCARQFKTAVSEFGHKFETLAQAGNPTEDASSFTTGERYQVIHHDAKDMRAEEGVYEGFIDEKHVFIVTKGEKIRRLAISLAALKYYTITPCVKQ